ncbi:MAG: ferritin-like domain-containing protein [Prochlorococcaceae cyanobacterium]|jgi:bacterioferritin
MSMDAAHPRVLACLGRALSLELTAVQQYMTQASLVELWGDAEAAERFRRETVEELRHAESLIQRMLALGVAPAASQLRPVTHAADLAGLLRHNLRLEQDLIQLYGDAVRFCTLIGDAGSGELFAALLADEEHHTRELESWYRSLPSHADPYAAWVSERATF